jgi:F-type H+-transporting ATPase subunit gamma
MAQATRELKRRIRGITNTQKITKAMELVSASKMRRAVQAALTSRAYALRAHEVLTNLSTVTDRKLHPLLQQRPIKRALLVVFTSDRGFAGGLNAQVVRQAVEAAKAFEHSQVDIVAMGRKGQDALMRLGFTITASFPTPARLATLADVLPIARIAIDGYVHGAYDRIIIVGTDYLSAISQQPYQRTLLPITKRELEGIIASTAGLHDMAPSNDVLELNEYLFEPSPDEVLEAMLVRLVEVQLYQGLLEAVAAEHAARMLAMRNATDAANDLIDGLTLEFNKARQAGITKDLAEISASRAVLT